MVGLVDVYFVKIEVRRMFVEIGRILTVSFLDYEFNFFLAEGAKGHFE